MYREFHAKGKYSGPHVKDVLLFVRFVSWLDILMCMMNASGILTLLQGAAGFL